LIQLASIPRKSILEEKKKVDGQKRKVLTCVQGKVLTRRVNNEVLILMKEKALTCMKLKVLTCMKGKLINYKKGKLLTCVRERKGPGCPALRKNF
jgi:hypothetical protein